MSPLFSNTTRMDMSRIYLNKCYKVLGHFITQYVYELLERVCMLQKVYIPTDATEDEPRSFFS